MDPAYDAAQIRFVPFSKAELKALDVRDPYWDDAYRIDVEDGRGVIAVSNARSALLGTYRLLSDAAAPFCVPGPRVKSSPAQASRASNRTFKCAPPAATAASASRAA